MLKKCTFLWLLLVVVLLAGSASLLSRKTLGQKGKQINQEPTAEVSESEPSSPRRQAKGRRYDRPKSARITELPSGDVLPLNAHWWMGIPALPVAQSDAIVIGSVLSGRAYLSENRTAVYSEFPVVVEDVLKNLSPTPVYFGATIIGERWGGAVRFRSGKVQHYRAAKLGVPQPNEKYVLFLKHNGEDFDIITGYSISGGRVSPLDGDGDLQFSKYANTPLDSFLSELREEITTSLAKEVKTK
jgi:hypothetical protein